MEYKCIIIINKSPLNVLLRFAFQYRQACTNTGDVRFKIPSKYVVCKLQGTMRRHYHLRAGNACFSSCVAGTGVGAPWGSDNNTHVLVSVFAIILALSRLSSLSLDVAPLPLFPPKPANFIIANIIQSSPQADLRNGGSRGRRSFSKLKNYNIFIYRRCEAMYAWEILHIVSV